MVRVRRYEAHSAPTYMTWSRRSREREEATSELCPVAHRPSPCRPMSDRPSCMTCRTSTIKTRSAEKARKALSGLSSCALLPTVRKCSNLASTVFPSVLRSSHAQIMVTTLARFSVCLAHISFIASAFAYHVGSPTPTTVPVVSQVPANVSALLARQHRLHGRAYFDVIGTGVCGSAMNGFNCDMDNHEQNRCVGGNDDVRETKGATEN